VRAFGSVVMKLKTSMSTLGPFFLMGPFHCRGLWTRVHARRGPGRVKPGKAPTEDNTPAVPSVADELEEHRERSTRARMYGPAARRKTDFQDGEREVLHQCIRPRRWSMSLRASMDIRAHPRLS